MTLFVALALAAADPGLSLPKGDLAPGLLNPLQMNLSLPPENAEGAGPSRDELAESVRFPVEGDEWLEDPLLVIDSEMNSSARDLASGHSSGGLDRSAGRTQPRIVSRLDRLILLLEKKCKGGSAAGNNPTRPAGDSNLAAGPGGQGELREQGGPARGMDRLSDEERARILQTQAAGFPPGFDDVLTDYYRRLATEQAVIVEEAGQPAASESDGSASALGE